jgi:hypothetical protein
MLIGVYLDGVSGMLYGQVMALLASLSLYIHSINNEFMMGWREMRNEVCEAIKTCLYIVGSLYLTNYYLFEPSNLKDLIIDSIILFIYYNLIVFIFSKIYRNYLFLFKNKLKRKLIIKINKG